MRIQLILLTLMTMFAFPEVTNATDDKTLNELFTKYDLIMNQKKVEYVDEVFTKKFLKESGGKEVFISKVKELPPVLKSKLEAPSVTWKKGLSGKMIFARLKPQTPNKTKPSEDGPEFVIKTEDGKLKIDGTISDGE